MGKKTINKDKRLFYNWFKVFGYSKIAKKQQKYMAFATFS